MPIRPGYKTRSFADLSVGDVLNKKTYIFFSYIFSIENVNDVQEYLYQLLDSEDSNVRDFVKKMSKLWDTASKQNISTVCNVQEDHNKEVSHN